MLLPLVQAVLSKCAKVAKEENSLKKKKIIKRGWNFSNDKLLWVIDFRVAALVYSSKHLPIVTPAAVLSVGDAKTWSDCRVHIQEASKQAKKFNGYLQLN